MITEAELSAMYGRGLHPDTAARVIEEMRRLRASLAKGQAEYDELEARLAGALLILERNLPWERQYLAPVLRGEMVPGEVRATARGEDDRG